MKKFADILSTIGNSFNLVKDNNSNNYKYPEYIKDDRKAIEEAWKEVGKDLSKFLPK